MNTNKSLISGILLGSVLMACTATLPEGKQAPEILTKKEVTIDSLGNSQLPIIKSPDTAMYNTRPRAAKLDSLLKNSFKRFDSLLKQVSRKIKKKN